jgi:mRNA-degrading endonuclease RelE of RelBE toxin-antitoxin system
MEQKTYSLFTDIHNVSKFLSKQDKKVRDKLKKEIEDLQFFPLQGDIKKVINEFVAGMQQYRKKVGVYRIFFIIDHKKQHVHVLKIKHRKDAY